MFKPCPNCGFLVALIKGREASQRCPRCGSAMLEDGELPPAEDAAIDTAPLRAVSHRGDGGSAAPGVAIPGGRPLPAEHGVTGAPGHPPRDDARYRARADGDGGAAGIALAPPAADVSVATEVAMPTARDGSSAVGTPTSPDGSADGSPGGQPSFAARRAVLARRRYGPWAVALPLLASLLGLQLLLSQRAELALDARWRPAVVAVCGILACDVPPWREPTAFAMLAREVRPHPNRAGVLRVSTSLRNDARWPQPLPVVLLSLSDVEGRVLAARAVVPADYGRRPSALVDPGDSVDIAFDVREPSPRVVSFDFELR